MTSNVSDVEGTCRFYITADTPAHERKTLWASLSTDVVSLLVVDCPFNGDSLEIYLFHQTDDIERGLDTLPAHEERVARIFDYSFEFEKHQLERLREHFNKVYQPSNGILNVSSGYATSVHDLDNIASQWASDYPGWLKAEGSSPRLQDIDAAFKYVKCLPIEKDRLLGKFIRAMMLALADRLT